MGLLGKPTILGNPPSGKPWTTAGRPLFSARVMERYSYSRLVKKEASKGVDETLGPRSSW